MYRIICLLACCFVLAACDNGTTPPAGDQWEVTVSAEPGWEGLSGVAAVQATGTGLGFVATMELTGDEPGAVRPWHVHFNSCADGGGIVGADGDYPRLQVGAGGAASATATVPVALDPSADYHINVHLSEPEMATIIACGDLVLSG